MAQAYFDVTTSWHGEYFGTATIDIPDMGTDDYALVVTPMSPGAIPSVDVAAVRQGSADIMVLLPYSTNINLKLAWMACSVIRS